MTDGRQPLYWPVDLPVSRVRFARPTNDLDAVHRFYVEGLGLERLGGFDDHAGYDGIMIGLPDWSVHLEFTHETGGAEIPAPPSDSLLVLYVDDRGAMEAKAAHLAAMGYAAIEPRNPYWKGRAITITDPDGWQVTLCERPA